MENKQDEELKMLFLEKQLIEEVKKRKEKQQRAETLLKEAKKMGIDTSKYREALLDIEIENINELIKNSKPKWDLINYDEFINYKYYSWEKKNLLNVYIYENDDRLNASNVLKNLIDSKEILSIFHSKDEEYECRLPEDISANKIKKFLKLWIYYSNTKIEKNKIKFKQNNTRLRYILALIIMGLLICFVIGIIIIIFLIITVAFL